MTEEETRELLQICGAYDDTPYGEPAAIAWHDALTCPWVPNLSLDEAHAAVIEHYQATPVRVTPADVLRRVRDGRAVGIARIAQSWQGVPPNEEYRQARAELDRKLELRRRLT